MAADQRILLLDRRDNFIVVVKVVGKSLNQFTCTIVKGWDNIRIIMA
jgi:phage regulator Rha-like protein